MIYCRHCGMGVPIRQGLCKYCEALPQFTTMVGRPLSHPPSQLMQLKGLGKELKNDTPAPVRRPCSRCGQPIVGGWCACL